MQINTKAYTVNYKDIVDAVACFILNNEMGLVFDVVDADRGAISSVLITNNTNDNKVYVEAFNMYAEVNYNSEQIINNLVAIFKYSGYCINKDGDCVPTN